MRWLALGLVMLTSCNRAPEPKCEPCPEPAPQKSLDELFTEQSGPGFYCWHSERMEFQGRSYVPPMFNCERTIEKCQEGKLESGASCDGSGSFHATHCYKTDMAFCFPDSNGDEAFCSGMLEDCKVRNNQFPSLGRKSGPCLPRW
jgi:hypothetical protein